MPQISSKNHSDKIMKKTLKTAVAVLSLLLITSLISVNEVKAEEVKKEQKSVSQKQQNQKITYTKTEEEAVLKKIDDLNKNPSLEYGKYLTRREMLIRLEMMKKKYPIKWYLDMMKRFDFSKCNDHSYFMDYHCAQDKLLYKIEQDKIISILLHYDDLINTATKLSKKEGFEGSYWDYVLWVDPFIATMMLTGIKSHINSYAGNDPRPFQDLYSQAVILSHEIQKMIENKVILINYNVDPMRDAINSGKIL